MQQIADWLNKLGLSEYAERFGENGIDISVLPHLTDHDLKDMGVLLGHRRKLLAVIGELNSKPAARAPATGEPIGSGPPSTAVAVAPLIPPAAEAAGERRYLPIADPQHARNAVRTAAEIQRVMHERKFAGVELVTRIGINTGMVIAANVGSGRRVHYAVYGDAVNLAARLEQLNKEYGTRVLVSGTTMELLDGDHKLLPVGEVVVRGKTVPVKLYRLDSPA